jgi:hypothetical protein
MSRPGLTRRAWLLGSGALVACSRREPAQPPKRIEPAPEAGDVGATRLLSWSFDADAGGPEEAVAVVPTWGGNEARFPLVVALHGRGESLKAPAEGAMGWPRDYALVRAVQRLCAPPLDADALEGFVDAPRLELYNRELAARPFGGLVVACPYVPDVDVRGGAGALAFGRFVLGALLSRAHRETPSLASPASTGIDGVSLGGAVALHVGLAHPEVFGAVGAIQPAVHEEDVGAWTERARSAILRKPELKLRLVTSHDDYFRDAILKLSSAWDAAGVAHELVEMPGPHDYAFNRGPGSIELLMWHDRVLARG